VVINTWPNGGSASPVSFEYTEGQVYNIEVLYARVSQDGITLEWNFLAPADNNTAFNQAVQLAASVDLG
jgi:hypothetical protein